MGYTINVGPDGDALVGRESSPDRNRKSSESNQRSTSTSTSATTTINPQQDGENSVGVQSGHTREDAMLGGGVGIGLGQDQGGDEGEGGMESQMIDIEKLVIEHRGEEDTGYESPESRDEEEGGARLDEVETEDEDAESERKKN